MREGWVGSRARRRVYGIQWACAAPDVPFVLAGVPWGLLAFLLDWPRAQLKSWWGASRPSRALSGRAAQRPSEGPFAPHRRRSSLSESLPRHFPVAV